MHVINLTQHAATAEQMAAGVVEPQDKTAVNRLLTFETCPDRDAIRARAPKPWRRSHERAAPRRLWWAARPI
jgi:hypothetical protein